MRLRLLLSFSLLSAVACGAYGYEVGDTTITGAPMITSGPAAGEAELPRTLRYASEAIALGVCQHETYCGRGGASCVDATVKRARTELSRWRCEPAAIRARFEECLAGFEAQPCVVNLQTEKRPFCPSNIECGAGDFELIPPGPALAEIWK